MARQVYYDPYGMRTEGFRAGMKDMMELQDQTRRARASDWDYNNIAPLRLAQARREDQYGIAALPYRERALGINENTQLGGLYDANQQRFAQYGMQRGDYAPLLADQDLYTSGQYGQASALRSPYMQYTRANLDQSWDTFPGLEQIAANFGISPQVLGQALNQVYGNVTPQTERGVDSYYLYDRSRQDALDNYGITEGRARLQNSADNAAINAYNAQTLGVDRYGRAMSRGAQVGGYTGEEDGFGDDDF